MCARLYFANSRTYFKTVFQKFRWKLGSGIVAGLCVGCATLKYFATDCQRSNFVLANIAVKGAEVISFDRL